MSDDEPDLMAEWAEGMKAHPRWGNKNPMVQKRGLDPEGRKCGPCQHFILWHHNGNKKFWKCKIRGCTSGPGTDHRQRWDACILFEEDHENQIPR